MRVDHKCGICKETSLTTVKIQKHKALFLKRITLSETFKIYSYFSLFSRMDADNPWQVESIEAFYFLKCPECMYFTQKDSSFYHHAVENHLLSFAFFGKPDESKELFAQKYILNEDVHFKLKQTKSCDKKILLSEETKHLKEIEKKTEIVMTD
jgi:hypothetical protein